MESLGRTLKGKGTMGTNNNTHQTLVGHCTELEQNRKIKRTLNTQGYRRPRGHVERVPTCSLAIKTKNYLTLK